MAYELWAPIDHSGAFERRVLCACSEGKGADAKEEEALLMAPFPAKMERGYASTKLKQLVSLAAQHAEQWPEFGGSDPEPSFQVPNSILSHLLQLSSRVHIGASEELLLHLMASWLYGMTVPVASLRLP